MTEIKSDNFVEYCAYVLSYLRYMMGFTGQDICIKLANEDDHDALCKEWQTTTASISCDHVYGQNIITLYPTLRNIFVKGELEDIATTLVHEMCHMYLAPVQSIMQEDCSPSRLTYSQQTLERQTECISKAINFMLPDGWWEREVLKSWYNASLSLGSLSKKGDKLPKKKAKKSPMKKKKC